MTPSAAWLSTERLDLRRFTPADRAWLSALYRDVEVTRHLGGTKTQTEVDTFFETRILDYYDRHPGLGMWLTVERATGAPVGFHLLNHIQGESIVQVGFGLARSAWGNGYATEMALEVLRYGFVDLRLPRLVGMAGMGNIASQHVLEKIGLHRHGERSFPHPAYASQGPLAWFERDAPDWIAERR